MTTPEQLFTAVLVDEPRDDHDLDLVAVVAAGRVRRQRRRRWMIGAVTVGTAVATVAVSVGPRLLEESSDPDPAPPAPRVVPVEVLSLEDAEGLPQGVLRTHHAPGDLDGVDWDRWAGVTEDGYVLRIRNVHEANATRFGLVDPTTGRTEWLPESGYDFGDPEPLRLGSDELVFLDNRQGTGAVAVYDRADGRWVAYAPFSAFDNAGERVYQVDPLTRASVDDEDRLWIKLHDAPADETSECRDQALACTERWWSVPFREGGPADRAEEYDGSSLAWEGGTGVSASAEGLTITTPAGRVTAPLAAPEGCVLREGFPPVVHAASPIVVGIPCADGSATVVVHDGAGAPLFALPAGDYPSAVAGEGYVGVVSGSGPDAELLLVEVESRRAHAVVTGPHTEFTDIGSGLVVWQSPEQGWLERDGSDYWVAELP